MSRPPSRLAFAVLFLVALGLRTIGNGFALPSRGHPFSFHPDEYNTVRALRAMRPAALDFNPRYFHNPALYYLSCGIAAAAAGVTGQLGDLERVKPHEDPRPLAAFYRIGRLISGLAGAATALVVAALAHRQLGPTSGIVAGLLVALAPGHVVFSQYMDVDALLGLFSALALARALELRERPGLGPAALAGALAGLAIATKYNGALCLLPVLAATQLGPAPRAARALAALAAATLAFVVTNPYAVLDFPAFRDGIRFVLEQRVSGRWSSLDHGLLFPLLRVWPWLVGEGALVLAAAGMAVGLRRRPRDTALVASLALAVYASVAASGADYARYGVPALPAIAWLAVQPFAHARPGWPRGLHAAALGLAVAIQLLRLSALLPLLREPDPRIEASRWLTKTQPRGTRILVPREPYYGSPPRLFTDHHYRGKSAAWRDPEPHFLVPSADWDASVLDWGVHRLVVVSETELLYPAAPHSPAGAFLAALFDGRYRELARFEKPAQAWPGLLLEAPLPGPGTPYDAAAAAALRDRRLPHDLKYLNPSILVLEREPPPEPEP